MGESEASASWMIPFRRSLPRYHPSAGLPCDEQRFMSYLKTFGCRSEVSQNHISPAAPTKPKCDVLRYFFEARTRGDPGQHDTEVCVANQASALLPAGRSTYLFCLVYWKASSNEQEGGLFKENATKWVRVRSILIGSPAASVPEISPAKRLFPVHHTELSRVGVKTRTNE